MSSHGRPVRNPLLRFRPPALLIALALLVALPLLQPPALAGQEAAERPSEHRKWLYAFVGAAALGVPAIVAEDFNLDIPCGARTCYAPVAAVAGFTVGFLVGQELDDAARRRFVPGPRVEMEGVAIPVPFRPERAVAGEGGTFVLGPEGIIELGDESVLSVRTVRGLYAAEVLAARRAVVGVTSGDTWVFSTENDRTRGRRVLTEGGSVLAGDGEDRLVIGSVDGLRLMTVTGTGDEVELTESVRRPLARPPAAARWPDGGAHVWVLDRSRIVALVPSTLEEVGALELPIVPRTLDVDGGVAVVTGPQVVMILDLSEPTAPRLASTWEGVRDPRGAALLGGKAYVAGGAQGLVVLDLSNIGAPAVSGVVGNLGRPAAVVRTPAGLLLWEDGSTEVLRVVPRGEP